MEGLRERRGISTRAASTSGLGGEAPLSLGAYVVKRAETEAELDQVHRLNYETFVREVPQHDDTGLGRLVNKFDHKNAYWIAKLDDEVVGMIATHDRPPFSISDRLAEPLQASDRPLEVRLLAVRPSHRRGPVFLGLLWAVHEHARRQGYSRLLISGVVERLAIYEKLGFRALGPAVPGGRAAFVPMGLDLERPPRGLRRMVAWWEARLGEGGRNPLAATRSLLPGPVEVSAKVRRAWAQPPVSHREAGFIARFEATRDRLARLVGGDSRVALFCGTGTLANDVVAASLASDRGAGSGLILANGEFGERLARQARRSGLKTRVLRQAWGRPWDLEAVAEAVASDRSVGWIWGVHLETSTGMLNDLEALRELASKFGVRLCLDCMSSLGALPFDLRGVHLATSCSGKALGSYAGLGIVFAGPEAAGFPTARRSPASLDLRAALAISGPRTTFPSPSLAALERALDGYDGPDGGLGRFEHLAGLGRLIRAGLRGLGIDPIADEGSAAPVITSFAPPSGLSADSFASACRSIGFEVAHASGYLRRRGWAQIATMGAVDRDDLTRLFDGLARRLGRSKPDAPVEA